MKLKLEQGIRLTQAQVLEIAKIIMTEPDLGWDYDLDSKSSNKTNVYEDKLIGKHASYHYRVNLSFKMITILKVE